MQRLMNEERDKLGLARSVHVAAFDTECPWNIWINWSGAQPTSRFSERTKNNHEAAGVQRSMNDNQEQSDSSVLGDADVDSRLARKFSYGAGGQLAYNQPSEDKPEGRQQRTENRDEEPASSVPHGTSVNKRLAFGYQFGPGGQPAYQLTDNIDDP